MLPGARFSKHSGSRALALEKSRWIQIRGAHPCRSARMGQPQIVAFHGAKRKAGPAPTSVKGLGSVKGLIGVLGLI
jgi:hypothetical protein